MPDTQNGFQPNRQLRYQDCVMVDKERVVVGIRWAKNMQFSWELLTFPLPVLPGSMLCPFSALERVRRLVKHNPQDHVFKIGDGIS